MKKNNPIVKSINNFLIKVEGDFNYEQNQFFKINKDLYGFLLSASQDRADLIISNPNTKIELNKEIEPILFDKIETNSGFFGKIINIKGEILNKNYKENNNIISFGKSEIFKTARGINERKKINQPLFTGYFGIDLFTPIGRGQRQLIVGDRKTGKTHLTLSSIINNCSDNNIRFIYASIGQKNSSISEIYEILKNNGCLDKSIIIHAESDNSYDQFLLPYVAMVHAENLSKNNFDVILILDDLTKHANIYREISLLLNKPAGREAFPGDVFFTHSKLLERGGNFKDEGSITVFPIVETNSGDITSFISSNIISITDGQIVISSELFNSGIIPAINYPISVSRTGSSVQNKQVSELSKELTKVYNNYIKNHNLNDIKFNLSDTFTKTLNQGKNIEKILTQKGFNNYLNTGEIILFSKLVIWNILDANEDNQDLFEFIFSFLQKNKWANKIYNKLICSEFVDEFHFKNFIINAINDFYNYKGITKKISQEINFKKINENEMKEYLGE
ncbi:MSC_0619 family F1-like ATPase alpha subunit [Mycoplasma sp. AC157]